MSATCPVPGCAHPLPCPWHRTAAPRARRRSTTSDDDDRRISKDQRRAQVLAVLVAHAGQWVPGPELATPAVGGSEGLRRLRELREPRYGGHKIPARRMSGRDGYEYMLII